MEKNGSVLAVCISSEEGIPKYPYNFATVTKYGLEGDYHCREMRPSFSQPGIFKPNTDRQISLVAWEVIVSLNKELLLNLVPGSLGENITTMGLGDLSDIPNGTLIRCGHSVILEVCKQNQPCKVLASLHPHLNKTIYGKRGLLCAIHQGINFRICPSDRICLVDS